MSPPPPSAALTPEVDLAAERRGRLLVLAAAVLWSTSGAFTAVLGDKFSGPELAFWRALFAGLALATMARRPRWSWRLPPMVLAFAVMNYTYLSAMIASGATCAIWLQQTAPAWVVVLGGLLLGERARGGDWPLLGLALAGIGVILVCEMRGGAGGAPGVALGLVSGLTYALVVLSLRGLRTHDPAWLIAVNHLGAAALLAPFAIRGGHMPVGREWLLLAAFGVLQMGLPYMLFARGLRHISGLRASAVALLEPLLVPVWVFAVAGILPRPWILVGGALILAGLLSSILWRDRA